VSSPVDVPTRGDTHGLDVDEEGHGTVAQERLYQLVRARESITDRTLEIAATGATLFIAAVFGVVGWVADLIVVGVIAIVVTIVATYVLSRP
jgi:hypothetical protein